MLAYFRDPIMLSQSRFTSLAVGLMLALTIQAWPSDAEPGASRLQVQCSRASAFVSIQIEHDRRIGNVILEIRDQQGRVIYREEGKALTGELVRRLDKGQLPRGTHRLSVHFRDQDLSQEFTIE